MTRGTHYLQLHRPDVAMKHLRSHAKRVFSPLVPAFAVAERQGDDATAAEAPSEENGDEPGGVGTEEVELLPENVNLLTLQAAAEDKVLLRLEHMFAVGEDPLLSQPVSVNVTALVSSLGFTVAGGAELSLTTNQLRRELKHLQWKTEEISSGADLPSADTEPHGGVVSLGPMEIRTFVIDLEQ